MPTRYDGGETYYVDWEGNPTPLEGGRGPPTFGKGKLAKEGGVTQRLTLTPHYRGEDIPCSAEEGRTTCTKGGGRPGSAGGLFFLVIRRVPVRVRVRVRVHSAYVTANAHAWPRD